MSGSSGESVKVVKAENIAEQVTGKGVVPATGLVRGAEATDGPEQTMPRATGRAKAAVDRKESGATGATLKLRNDSQPFERLLSEDEVIDLLGLRSRKNPRSSLRWLMRTRQLAYYRLGKGINGFSREDIVRFLAEHRVDDRGGSAGRVA